MSIADSRADNRGGKVTNEALIVYEQLLESLRMEAAKRDFSAEGDAAYFQLYLKVKAAYWKAAR